MSDIIAIGGGTLSERETIGIDREIVRRTGEEQPTALFLPTASTNPGSYAEEFHDIYGKVLGCDTCSLFFRSEDTESDLIQSVIDRSDLVYVGGGNTLNMMNVWRSLGVDEMLKDAYRDGTVLSGLSAGAICWFDGGHSDSMYYESGEGEDWEYIHVSGLGLVEGVFCPHFHDEDRVENFLEMMAGRRETGIGADDCAALHVHDGAWRVLSERNGNTVYKTHPAGEGEDVRMESLDPSDAFRPCSDLYSW